MLFALIPVEFSFGKSYRYYVWKKQRDKMNADAITIGGMMFELGELDTLPVVFDEKLWHGTIDHVTVHADERVVFMFKDGKEIVTRL